MECLVCHASFIQGATCPQCGYDQDAPGAREPAAVHKARAAFRAKTSAYAPALRVTAKDKLIPWLALGLGLVLFVFWVRTCASGGRLF